MAPGAASTLWKSVDGYKLSTGDYYTAHDLVEFHNESFKQYFVDFTTHVPTYDQVFVAQLQLVSHLSLYLHTDSDEFVGMARSCQCPPFRT